jgi:hypothetical protein
MGKSYNSRGYLCCNDCGAGNGETRNIKCPFGYCYAPSLCPPCAKKAKWNHKATHIAMGCDVKQAAFVAEQNRRIELIANGTPVRCSASNWSDAVKALGRENWVHVLFETNAGTIGYFMSGEAYDAFPLGKIATPDMYATVSELIPAPNKFHKYGL